MKQAIRGILKVVVGLPSRLVPERVLAKAVYAFVEAMACARTPGKSMGFLLTLDRQLSSLTGMEAVRLEGGVHPKFRLTRYHEFFTARLSPGEKVLDIGTGTGFLAYVMAETGAEVTGIELVGEKVDFARKRFSRPNLRYMHGDALRDLPDESFDTVVMSNVLEHIEDRPGFLRSVQERLRPVRWLLRVPMFERDWRVPMARELGLQWMSDDTHFTEHTEAEFRAELARAGLEVRHFETRWGEIWCEAGAEAVHG